MNTEEILEGNKLIAEFMGGELYTHSVMKDLRYRNLSEGKSYNFSMLRYHSSWYWLMPVVEKIRNDHFVNIEMYGDFVAVWITKDKDLPKTHQKIYSEDSNTIIAIYGAVVQFIKWYTTQNQTK